MNLLQTYFDQLRSTNENTHSFLLVQDHARSRKHCFFVIIQPESHHLRPSLKFKSESDALAPCLPIRQNSQPSMRFCSGNDCAAPPSAPYLPKRQNSQSSLGSCSKDRATSPPCLPTRHPSLDNLRLGAPSIPTRKNSFDDLTQLTKTSSRTYNNMCDSHTIPSRNKNKLFTHIAPPIRSHSSPIFRSGSKQQRTEYFLNEVKKILLGEESHNSQ